ncbi:Segregation and condensation protein B homolog [Brucella anthropi]|nr:Segregation and condensation protein B homolog [Brucella anthropi]
MIRRLLTEDGRSGLRARLKTITLGGQPAVRTARKFRGGTRTFRPFLLPGFLGCDDGRILCSQTIPQGQTSVASARLFDRELEDLPQELRWQEWMLRVEAVIFASAEPVSRETLARVVGKDCSIDLLIEDLRQELSSRPYELVSVAGGWQHRTRPRFAETICASSAPTRGGTAALSEFEAMVLMAVGYFQPVTRGELSKIFGKEVSRDTIGQFARRWLHRLRATQSDAGCAVYLCDNAALPLGLWHGNVARPAEHRGARGCRFVEPTGRSERAAYPRGGG